MSAVGLAAEAAKPVKPAAARKPALCELELAGRPVERLKLRNEQGQATEFVHPGPTLQLPPGRYRIEEICVAWDANRPAETDTDVNWLTLAPLRPCRLDVGSLRTPVLSASHHGKTLTLLYRTQTGGDRSSDARVDIYQHGRKISSGSFKYG